MVPLFRIPQKSGEIVFDDQHSYVHAHGALHISFYHLFINTISDNDLVLKGAITYYPRDKLSNTSLSRKSATSEMHSS